MSFLLPVTPSLSSAKVKNERLFSPPRNPEACSRYCKKVQQGFVAISPFAFFLEDTYILN